MKRVFVNASAAKSGGGATIIETFLAAKAHDNKVQYIIASPVKPKKLGDNQIWIKKRTSMIGTIFYAMVGSWFVSKKYNCQSIISFSNVNTLLPTRKVTYFQNMLVLTGSSFKWVAIRYLAKLTLRNNTLVAQTPYVKEQLLEFFGEQCKVLVKWPGIDIRKNKNINIDSKFFLNSTHFFNILVPIQNTSLEHKNFTFVLQLANRCIDYPIQFLVTSDKELRQGYGPDNVIYIGSKDRNEYLSLLDVVDATIVTSTVETVGLPIFESLANKKYCFVFKQKYLDGITELFGSLDGLLVFSNEEEFVKAYHVANNPFPNGKSPYINGDWDF